MRSKKLLCLLIAFVMAVSTAACGNSGKQDVGSEVKTTAEETQTKPAPSKDAQSVLPDKKDISSEDISVLWDDSRFFTNTSLNKYETVKTYAVKGFDDIPFMTVSDYMRVCFDQKPVVTMDKGVCTISLNGTEATINPETDTIHFENPARFRTEPLFEGGIEGGIVSKEDVNVITASEKNKPTQTQIEALDISLDGYHMPILTVDDDLLMPFMALQNTFGAITWSNVMAYNGKDYYNVNEVSSYASEHSKKAAKSPYAKSLYSGPFSEKEKTTTAFAEHAYYAICLLLDYCYGHKEEKNITSFDEYFSRTNTKKLLMSTDPSTVQMAEFIIFMYLFDSGHDAVMTSRTVFKPITEEEKEKRTEETEKVIEEVKNSEDGKKMFDEAQKKDGAEESDELGDGLIGVLEEKGFKIPEIAPLMAWTTYFSKMKPKDYGSHRVDYVDDTAVIYFNAFLDDNKREPAYYLDAPNQADEDRYNFAFFYRAFKDIKKHDKVKNVVINLSDNGGGAAGGLIAILGFLSKDGEVKMTDLDVTTNSYREECYHVDTNLDGVADDKDGFGGEYDFFIMTSPSSYSCANALPYFAQKEGLAKIIGAKPGGGDCVVGCFTDAYGNSGAFSGILKLGTMEGDKFVSNEKATKLDFDMMPSILDIINVPWFSPEGITEAVHQYKEGKKEITYPKKGNLENLPETLEDIMKEMEKESK